MAEQVQAARSPVPRAVLKQLSSTQLTSLRELVGVVEQARYEEEVDRFSQFKDELPAVPDALLLVEVEGEPGERPLAGLWQRTLGLIG